MIKVFAVVIVAVAVLLPLWSAATIEQVDAEVMGDVTQVGSDVKLRKRGCRRDPKLLPAFPQTI